MRVVETVPGAAALAASHRAVTASIEQQIPHDSISSTSSGVTNNIPTIQVHPNSKPLIQPVTTTIQLQHQQRPLAPAASPSVQTTQLIGNQQAILRGQLVQRPLQVASQQAQVINTQQTMTIGRQQPLPPVSGQSQQTLSQSTQQPAIVTQQQVFQQQKTNLQQQPIVISAQPQQQQQIVVMSQQPQQQQQMVTVQQQSQQKPFVQQGTPVHLQQVPQQTSTAVPQNMAIQQLPSQLQSLQVQLRVSNDESNRQFCLSWLKATYESSNGSSIDQQVMYKQYLASLHKLGKRDVISQQHYAVCIR